MTHYITIPDPVACSMCGDGTLAVSDGLCGRHALEAVRTALGVPLSPCCDVVMERIRSLGRSFIWACPQCWQTYRRII